jgi:alpha-galactosidase
MTKVTIVGAGSAVFARQIITDILNIDGLDEGTFALVDIDPNRLELAHKIAEKIVELKGKKWNVVTSTDRRDVLAGTDFVVNSIEVAGLANVRHDFDIPMKYGVNQCIGDTIGPGGIFKALRTGPAWLDIVRDAAQLAPNAMILNYTNPMSILTLAAIKTTPQQVVGLCHSVQGSSQELARYLGVPYNELEWQCAGINHNAWFTVLRHKGQDMYPTLLKRIAENTDIYERDPVRFEMTKYFGAFVTESSGHFSEYVPYFRKRPELIEKYCRAGYLGETGFYANNWPNWRKGNDEYINAMLSGEKEVPLHRSHEYASYIVEGKVFNKPQVIYGNVRNTGLIDNLPDGCVEVACLVDGRGIQPTHFGTLPEQLAGLNRTHMTVHALMVEALINKDKQAARYALQMDPLTAAVCSPAETSAMFDELWEAQREYLQPFE